MLVLLLACAAPPTDTRSYADKYLSGQYDDTAGDGATGDSGDRDTATGGDSGETHASDPPVNADIPWADCQLDGADGDGNTFQYRYNEDGHYVSYVYEWGRGDAADLTEAVTYQNGLETEFTKDKKSDGSIDYREAYTYADGLESTASYDNNGDGVYDELVAFTYDADGCLAGGMIDRDGDGTIDSVYVARCDDAGRVVDLTEDDGPDGTIDFRWTTAITTDNEGDTTYDELQDDADDGTIDATRLWTVNSDGNDLHDEADADGSGFADYAEDYVWDGTTLQTVTYLYNDRDGTLTSSDVDTYAHDAYGRWTGRSWVMTYASSGGSISGAWTGYWTCPTP